MKIEELKPEIYRLSEEEESKKLFFLWEEQFPAYFKNHTADEIKNLITKFEIDLMTYEKIPLFNFGIVFSSIRNKYDDIEKLMFLMYVLLCHRSAQEFLDEQYSD